MARALVNRQIEVDTNISSSQNITSPRSVITQNTIESSSPRIAIGRQVDINLNLNNTQNITSSSSLPSEPVSILTQTPPPIITGNEEVINLTKKVYAKNQYEKVINTKFSQLANTPTTVTSPTISIDEFFQYYNQLFFEIPKEGETNSHEYLIKTSSEYVNFTPINEDIQALIDEINILQQTNLELNQQLVELSTLNAPNTSSTQTL